jgi:hypothetical protein
MLKQFFRVALATDRADQGGASEFEIKGKGKQMPEGAQMARTKDQDPPPDAKPAKETGNDLDYQAGGGL